MGPSLAVGQQCPRRTLTLAAAHDSPVRKPKSTAEIDRTDYPKTNRSVSQARATGWAEKSVDPEKTGASRDQFVRSA